jgi:hypothetical protein
VSHDFDEVKKSVSVIIHLLLEGLPAIEDSEEPIESNVVFRIEASFDIKYSIADTTGLEKSHFEAFSRMNGVYNLWPYWREYVQNTLPRMGLPSLTLPVMTQAKIEKLTRQTYKNHDEIQGAGDTDTPPATIPQSSKHDPPAQEP